MAQETVLLTGATGNVGAVTLEHLLRLNHTVHLILRRASSIPHFKSKYATAFDSGHILFTVVPDMTVPGVFDEAAATATAIFHIATPIASENFVKTMVEPTWKIDHNILEAAKKSKSVKRVVICGTILQAASVGQFFDPSLTISSTTYNEIQIDDGVDQWVPAYEYAKTDAERKTWAWLKENKDAGFDVVMLLPPAITGRSPQEGFKPSAENPGGIGGIYKSLLNGDKDAIDGAFPIWL
jgi:NADPH-dependent methylglyoxal reductase